MLPVFQAVATVYRSTVPRCLIVLLYPACKAWISTLVASYTRSAGYFCEAGSYLSALSPKHYTEQKKDTDTLRAGRAGIKN